MTLEIEAGALSDLEAAVFARSGKVEGPVQEIRFCCPAHDDQHPSARYNREKRVWCCDACNAAGGFWDLYKRLDLTSRVSNSSATPRRQVGTYDYTDANGRLLFQVVRFEPKSFSQRRPNGDGWTWNLDGVTRVLYQLPNVLAVASAGWRVYVVEGEKDADALDAMGLLGTTSPHGAGKWRAEYAEALTGADVVIVPDRDEPGRRHALDIARSSHGKAKTVRVLELPNPAAKDLSDWIALGGTKEELEALAGSAPIWAPDAEPVTAHVGLSIPAIEFVGMDIPPVEWLIDGIWQAQAVGFVAGPPKAFKSFMVLDLAFAVASGQNFLGRFPPGERRPRTVMLIQNESSKAAFRERVKATADRFLGIPPALRLITNVPIVLEDESWIQRIEAELEKFRPELLILDPLASMTTGDENSAQEMGSVIRRVRGWRDRFGCAVAIVHHSGKTSEKGAAKRSGEKMRGSSAFHGAVESALYVERVDDESPQITVKVEQKESEPPKPFVCEFQSETCQLVITGDVVQVTDEMIRKVVEARSGLSVSQILQELPRGTATVTYIRDRLKAMRGIRADARGSNKPTLYYAEPDSLTLPT
jgi:hypothetical protein